MPLNEIIPTLELTLRDFGRCIGVDVATYARAMLSGYILSNNDLGGDDSCSIILPSQFLNIHNEG